MLPLDDDQLVLERRACLGEIVHVERGADYRDRQRQQPHQPGVLNVEASSRALRCRQIEVDNAEAHQDRGQQLDAADADIPAGRVQAERPALHPVRVEERDVGHARGEIAAAKHQPERGIGLRDKIRERDGWDEQHRGAEDRPVSSAEGGYRKGVRKAHHAAHQSRQGHQLEELVGGVVKAGLRQLGRHDAPDQPDREAEVLGHDGPDQVAPGDDLALGLPELFVLWIPLGDPGCVTLAHLGSTSSSDPVAQPV